MWRWVKVPKAIALIAFFLPWITVSCTSTVLLSASGWSLASGRLNVVDPITGTAHAQQVGVNIWLVAALLVIVVGVVASFARRRAAAIVIVTSVAALTLVIGGTSRFSQRLLADELTRHVPGPAADRAARDIRIDRQLGYWIELAALIAAGGMAGLALTGRGRGIASPRPIPTADERPHPRP